MDHLNNMELRITIEVIQPGNGVGGLRLSETVKLKTKSFLEVCSVLTKFHELSEQLGGNDNGW